METTIKQTEENKKTNQKEQEIANKLKENIRKFFIQMKNGCYREFCYNPYCVKSECLPEKLTDKEILQNALKAAKDDNADQYLCKDGRVKLTENANSLSDVETFALSLSKDPSNLKKNFNNNFLLKLDIDIEKINKHYENNKNKDFSQDLINVNKFFDSFFEKNSKNYFHPIFTDKHNERLLFYLYHIYSHILIFISLSPNFCFLENLTSELVLFFTNYTIIRREVKKLALEKGNKDGHIEVFSELKNAPSDFSKIINNYQNFLALALFHIGDNEEEIRDERSFEVLFSLMKIFKVFYQINDLYKIIPFRDFYNDSVSKYLNLKEECKNYFRHLNKTDKNERPFSLIQYHWLFDAAAKSDILYIFNFHKQRTEMMGSLNDLMSLQMNLINPHAMFLYLEVKRNNLIEDTLNFISNSQINIRKPLKVKFVGEQGIDEGGVKKEFFLLLIRQLFDPDYGMFTYSDKNRFFWFNPHTFESKIKFELIGVILGLAFFNNVILDIKFPLVIYKKILGLPTSIDDLKEIDLELYNNFKYLLTTKEKGLKENLMTTFTVIVDQFGEKIVVPLKENGENIFIDEDNREEYVNLYLDWYFNKSIENVFVPFRNGFYRVCDNKLFHMLRPEELELIICGTQNLDFHELEKSARYDDGYEKTSPTIKLLWEVIHSLSPDEQKKFLFFLTGCDRAPINGLASLVITISRFGPDSDKLPCAHTCFNHMLLPDYQNKDKLRDRLLIAINNSEGFGLM